MTEPHSVDGNQNPDAFAEIGSAARENVQPFCESGHCCFLNHQKDMEVISHGLSIVTSNLDQDKVLRQLNAFKETMMADYTSLKKENQVMRDELSHILKRDSSDRNPPPPYRKTGDRTRTESSSSCLDEAVAPVLTQVTKKKVSQAHKRVNNEKMPGGDFEKSTSHHLISAIFSQIKLEEI